MILETQSENPRGNIPDVKKILNRASFVIGKEGSAAWLFDRRGAWCCCCVWCVDAAQVW